MKKHIILISIIISSCSSMKVEEQIASDFIKEKLLNNNFDVKDKNIYLIKDATSYKNALDYYEMAFFNKDFDIGDQEYSSVPQKLNSWPVNMDEIKTLKRKNDIDSSISFWEKKNFKAPDIIIIEKKELLKKAEEYTIPSGSTGHIVSKPILSLDKKYAFLTYSIVYFAGGTGENAYLLEKQNKKWKIIARFCKN